MYCAKCERLENITRVNLDKNYNFRVKLEENTIYILSS